MSNTYFGLFDTTLRDGLGSPSFRPTEAQRSTIAEALAEAGVATLEIAHASTTDREPARRLAMQLRGVGLCLLARATSDEVGMALSLLHSAERPRIHLYADCSQPDALAVALEAVFAARTNLDEVEFSPLATTELTPGEVIELALAASDSGATVFNVSDTRGTAKPKTVEALFSMLRDRLGDHVLLSFHGHDHEGRATVNSLAALRGGASQLHVTLNGLGPGGGNTSLQEVVASTEAADWDAARTRKLDAAALQRAIDETAEAMTTD